ncbi:LysM peptidoglycan-binding domain-containing protein [Paenochrobactrum sp. BZR 588]|uniref:LysM peptidoglycan-binding domain-containing protein n=1 Tax=unclassified Paenochrobactrum TaxID=2639760 RepID=UPI003851DB2B
MQKSRYALVGFAVVVILGGVLAFCGFPVKNTPIKGTDVSQPVAQAPVETKTAPKATPPQATEPVQKTDAEAKTVEPAAVEPQTTTENKESDANTASTAGVDVPVFDLVRVEPNGGVVIAGKSLPGAEVDVLLGSRVLGSVKASENGDFVIAFDEVLKPGDHSLVLRSTSTDNKAATSAQTAIVSIPDNVNGQVLALVEEPGQASRMITKPQTDDANAQNNDGDQSAQTNGTEASASNDGSASVIDAPIAVEAVEIEGNTIYIAGQAKTDHSVIVYANEKMLGRSNVSPEGRFLVESQQPLAVGDYIIRADLLNKNQKVIASARVPFRREAGDNISAVAPSVKEQRLSAQDGKSQPQPQQVPHNDKASAQALENVRGSVIIRKGDNLWTISKRTYGKGTRYTTIYLANRDQIRNPDLIWPGQVFTMPSEPLSENDAANALRETQPSQ